MPFFCRSASNFCENSWKNLYPRWTVTFALVLWIFWIRSLLLSILARYGDVDRLEVSIVVLQNPIFAAIGFEVNYWTCSLILHRSLDMRKMTEKDAWPTFYFVNNLNHLCSFERVWKRAPAFWISLISAYLYNRFFYCSLILLFRPSGCNSTTRKPGQTWTVDWTLVLLRLNLVSRCDLWWRQSTQIQPVPARKNDRRKSIVNFYDILRCMDSVLLS